MKTYEAITYLKAMAHPDRMRIIAELAKGETTVKRLHTKLRLNQPTCSGHLQRMRRENMVISRRERNIVWYSLKDWTSYDILKLLLDGGQK